MAGCPAIKVYTSIGHQGLHLNGRLPGHHSLHLNGCLPCHSDFHPNGRLHLYTSMAGFPARTFLQSKHTTSKT
ncbi:hypothetical protein PCASD_18727 [Puccinia coronata f. sp. avenae]|uniref:Uncharacterized protein n=1 Tax=Puccinia coronata f. sp. avenae TaxID=200324 RepID=A0A2N5TVK0_9BASI|nr:hypothetical protein PCASD_18727 [Puccinia coronata f. sp. avenae]